MEIGDKTLGELVEMMRDKVQELVDAEAENISADDAIVILTEAIMVGAAIIGTVKEQPISMTLGELAGLSLEAELQGVIDRRAEQAKLN